MSKIHIANFRDADRVTAKALASIDMGAVVSLIDDGEGNISAIPLTIAGQLKAGKYAVAMKFSADPLTVNESTVDADSGRDLGSRIVAISSGDFIVACGPGTILEYPQDELDASVTPSTVNVSDYLAIKSSKWSTIASGTITTPVAAMVKGTFGTSVLVQLLPVPVTP